MLETIWFLLWGILWAAYFITGGFDLGLGTMMPFLARNEEQRGTVITAMGPFWHGNEVWLIAAGGVTFAAFPGTYAVMFSALYAPLMLLLFGLIVRGVSMEFRGLVEGAAWRRVWDWGVVVGSFLPALLLGVAFANIFMGLPLNAQGVMEGNILTLLNPYGLAGGVLFVLLFAMHGSLWLAFKTTGELEERAGAAARSLWNMVVAVLAVFLVMSWGYTRLFVNYMVWPGLFVVLSIPVAGLVISRLNMGLRRWWPAWFSSSLAILGVTLFGIVGLYPTLIPSRLNPAFSLTVTGTASSPLTLKIMLGVTLVFVPLVIIYQSWAYLKFSHKVGAGDAYGEDAPVAASKPSRAAAGTLPR
jgi:cytochrome bd ubiquinol oxidase subunit II